ncbi:hypothetical protein JCM17961_11150 [Endothiovibrio diazotrophicus]
MEGTFAAGERDHLDGDPLLSEKAAFDGDHRQRAGGLQRQAESQRFGGCIVRGAGDDAQRKERRGEPPSKPGKKTWHRVEVSLEL